MAFKEMYPAVAGSPSTLTGSIYVAGTTDTLTVSQGTVLASAPNLATITAADGRFVTISYTSKSGNTISGLTALEGDKTGTFATGSIIARRYSAVDDSAIKNNIGEIYDNMIAAISANGTPLEITNKSVNIPLGTFWNAGLNFAYDSTEHNVYISPDGDDNTGDGTQTKPFREIQTAINKTREKTTKRITIVCAAGEYRGFTIPQNICPMPDYTLYVNGSITINGTITIANNNFYIARNNSDFSVLISTTSDIGIVVGRYGNLISQIPLTIIAGKYGIDSNVVGGSIILHNVDITLNDDNARYGIIMFQTANIIARNVTVNSLSGRGIAVGLANSSIGIVRYINSTITKYEVQTGSVLSLNGQLVNQSE